MGCLYCRPLSCPRGFPRRRKGGWATVSLKRFPQIFLDFTARVQKLFDLPILKVSGYGEFLVLPRAKELLDGISTLFERIQIITNATKLSERVIAGLAEIKGVNICVSLDGHTPELNYCRTTNERIIHKVLRNIEILRRYGLPVEVNTVLTQYNTSRFMEFISYLSQRYDRLICYPFPVRGNTSLSALGPKSAESLVSVMEKFEDLANVLPPRAYLERLISFITKGRRQQKCLVGYAHLGIDPAGHIPVCACNVPISTGNIFLEGFDLALARRASHPLFYRFFFPKTSFPGCRECFTHYEITNLYLDGTISLSEIREIPLFAGKRTQQRLRELRDLFHPENRTEGIAENQGGKGN